MASHEHTIDQFGLLMAYVVPGFIALWGASYFLPEIRMWVGDASADAPTLGGFLYMTVAAIAAGLTISTVRWMVIDTIHHWTGVKKPKLDFSQFAEHVAAYNTLNEMHYRYYQFYSNSLIALIWLFLAKRASTGTWTAPLAWTDVGILGVGAVFFLGSRDTLQKFYARTRQFLRRTTNRSGRRGHS